MKGGTQTKKAAQGETDTELVFRAATFVAKRGRLQQEVNKYFGEKDLIVRELQLFEVSPPNMGAAEINRTLGVLRDSLRRRNALYEKECQVVEDLGHLERQIDRFKFAEPGRIKDSAKANLQEMLTSLTQDVQYLENEKTTIMKEFNGVKTFEFSPEPPNEYNKLGMSQGDPRQNSQPNEGPGLAVDAMRIAEYLNTNYDKLQQNNPRLALELENIVKYLKGGDFTRQYKPAQIQEEIDKVETRRLEADKQKKKDQEARMKAKSTQEQKKKLQTAGAEMLNQDLAEVMLRDLQAQEYFSRNDYGIEDVMQDGMLYNALYGNQPEPPIVRQILDANQEVVKTNTFLTKVMQEQIELKEREADQIAFMESEYLKKKQELEAASIQLEIEKLNRLRNDRSEEMMLLRAIEDLNSAVISTQAQIASKISNQNGAQNGNGGGNNNAPIIIQAPAPTIVPMYLPNPYSGGGPPNRMRESGSSFNRKKNKTDRKESVRSNKPSVTESKVKESVVMSQRKSRFGNLSPVSELADEEEYIPCSDRPCAVNPVDTRTDFSVHVDGIRMLPDRICVTRVVVTIVDKQGKSLVESDSFTKSADIQSNLFSPVYGLEGKIRQKDLPSSVHADGLWAVINVFNIILDDDENNLCELFGFTVLPLFVTETDQQDPILSARSKLILHHGAFQLPLYNPKQTRDSLKEILKGIQ